MENHPGQLRGSRDFRPIYCAGASLDSVFGEPASSRGTISALAGLGRMAALPAIGGDEGGPLDPPQAIEITGTSTTAAKRISARMGVRVARPK